MTEPQKLFQFWYIFSKTEKVFGVLAWYMQGLKCWNCNELFIKQWKLTNLEQKIIIIMYHHLECLFSEGSVHNYYTKTRESNIATLLRQNNIAKYSKDCLCVLESPYFCLVFRCILHLEDEWQYQFCKGHLVAKKLGDIFS